MADLKCAFCGAVRDERELVNVPVGKGFKLACVWCRAWRKSSRPDET